MAATDMTKAGLEPGCLVEFLHPRDIAASLSDRMHSHLIALAEHNPWTFLRPKNDSYMMLEQRDQEPGEMPATVDAHRDDIVRVYDDAQTARHARFERLLAVFPGEAGVPEASDTVERFVCVQKNTHPTGDGSFAFAWGDTFPEAVRDAGGEIFDGWWPEAVFDLDTGQKVELHIASPVISISEDQGVTVNELNPDEVAEMHRYVEANYEPIAHEFEVAVTVPVERGDEMAKRLDEAVGASWVEHANVRRSVTSQRTPASWDRIKREGAIRDAELMATDAPDIGLGDPTEVK